jgi:hypothetical protein
VEAFYTYGDSNHDGTLCPEEIRKFYHDFIGFSEKEAAQVGKGFVVLGDSNYDNKLDKHGKHDRICYVVTLRGKIVCALNIWHCISFVFLNVFDLN